MNIVAKIRTKSKMEEALAIFTALDVRCQEEFLKLMRKMLGEVR